MKYARLLSLTLLLLFLAACSAQAQSSANTAVTASPTPSPTATPVVTPTIPAVPSRMVHFFTSDHVQLAGLLYGQGKTAVICSHEFRASKVIWSLTGMAQRLAASGYLVLAYDFRGNGDSQGQGDLSKMVIDLDAAIAFARQQGANRIVLLGSSMGGTATLKAAASAPVAAVVTLSAPREIGVTVTDADLKAIKAPKLFVNSQDDTYSDDTQQMYAAASPPKELHLYPGGAHGITIFYGDYSADLTQRILNFVAQYAPVS